MSKDIRKQRRVLIVLPDADYDPTEVAVPWAFLSEAGCEVCFSGSESSFADEMTLSGKGMGPAGGFLRVGREAAQFYSKMQRSPEFLQRIPWNRIDASEYDCLLLPGGHAPGMRSYLESELLMRKILDFREQGRLIAAICHGVLLLARTKDEMGLSVLNGHNFTTLLASQERMAWIFTAPWVGNRFRTYNETTEQEVTRLAGGQSFFQKGPLPLWKDSRLNLRMGFVVHDGQFLTARWPGDAYSFARKLIELL